MNLEDTESTALSKSLNYNVRPFSLCYNGVTILTYLKEQRWGMTKFLSAILACSAELPSPADLYSSSVCHEFDVSMFWIPSLVYVVLSRDFCTSIGEVYNKDQLENAYLLL